jgi:hypothetical protein
MVSLFQCSSFLGSLIFDLDGISALSTATYFSHHKFRVKILNLCYLLNARFDLFCLNILFVIFLNTTYSLLRCTFYLKYALYLNNSLSYSLSIMHTCIHAYMHLSHSHVEFDLCCIVQL